MSNILVVDDDRHILRLVSIVLKEHGFQTYEAEDGYKALKKLEEEKIDLCIVDIMMPNMDGYEFCRNAKAYHEDMPILMLTAKSEIASKRAGYQVGTDDYLTKPFETEELILRVRALLKRYKINDSQSVTVGALTVDRGSHTILADGSVMDIPMKEFELLFRLAGAQGRTLSRNQLIEDIWGYDFEGNERTVDVHINRLRERFPSKIYGFKIITVRSLGYRLEVIL